MLSCCVKEDPEGRFVEVVEEQDSGGDLVEPLPEIVPRQDTEPMEENNVIQEAAPAAAAGGAGAAAGAAVGAGTYGASPSVTAAFAPAASPLTEADGSPTRVVSGLQSPEPLQQPGSLAVTAVEINPTSGDEGAGAGAAAVAATGASGAASPEDVTLAPEQLPIDELVKRAEFNMRKHACTLWDGEDYVYREVWTTRKRELAAYGDGVYLYFQLMHLMSILCVVLMVVSMPALISYISGNLVNDQNKIYEFIARLSIANLGYCPGGICRTDQERRARPLMDGSTLDVIQWTYGIGIIDGLSMLIIAGCAAYYYFVWMPRSLNAVAEEHTTVGDYSIQVSFLPRAIEENTTYEDKLRTHFEERLQSVGVEDPDAVQEVALVRNHDGAIGNFLLKGQYLHQRAGEALKKARAVSAGDKSGEETAEKALSRINRRIESLDKSIGAQSGMTEEERQVCRAFVIFNRQEYKDEILYQYRLSRSAWFRCCMPRKKRFVGHKIRVIQACEPADIVWENADFSSRWRFLRKSVTCLVTFVLLIICTVVLVALQSLSKSVTEYEVAAKPVWVLKHAVASNTRCLNLCGLTMYSSLTCNEDEGSSMTWTVKSITDANGPASISLLWNALPSNIKSQCLLPWESPACSLSLNKTRPGDWLAVEFAEPQLVQCIELGQSIKQISDVLEIFQCDSMVLTSSQEFDPEKVCVPLKMLYPATSEIDNQVALSGKLPARMDVTCETGSMISMEVAQEAKAAASKPAKDPILGCYCTAKVTEIGMSFRFPPYDTEEKQLCQEWSENENRKLAKMVGAVTAVLITNTILEYVFEYLIIWERHASQRDITYSRQWKLLLSQFINTGVLILIVNANFQGQLDWVPLVKTLKIGQGDFMDFAPGWFSAVGASLCVTIAFTLVSRPAPTIFMSFILNPIMIRIFSKGLVTQETLNGVYQLQPWHLSLKLAQSLTVIFVIFMYAGGMPILYFIGFVYCLLTYWVEKWSLLKGSCKPPKFDSVSIRRALSLIPVAVFFHSAITLWMYGNQQVFPSEWSEITSLLESILGIDRSRYESIIRQFENGSAATRNALFDDYLHARALDMARNGCWLLLLIFVVLGAIFVIYVLLFLVFRPLIGPLETCIKARSHKMRQKKKRESTLESKAFSEIKMELAGHGHETSYFLAYAPMYQDAYVGITGLPAPPLHVAENLKTAVSKEKQRLKPPGVCCDPLTHIMFLLSIAAGAIIVLAIVWNS